MRAVCSAPAMATVSVISSSRQSGGSPLSCRADLDDRQQVGALELPRREVDGQTERPPDELLPGARLAAGLAQHVAVEAGDQGGLLGQRDEAQRRQHAELGVVPAHERLDADDRAGVELDLRLVVDQELAASSTPICLRRRARGAAPSPWRSAPPRARSCSGRRSDSSRRRPAWRAAWPSAPARSASRRRGRRSGRWRRRCWRSRETRGSPTVHGFLKLSRDLVGDGDGVGGAFHVGQEQDELVAAGARQRVALADRCR